MKEHSGTPRLRGWLALFTATFVGFLLLNGMAVIHSASNRTNRLYPLEYSAERIAAIQQLATYETFGRLGFLLVGAYVFWLLHRRDRRLVRFFAIYSGLFAPFELALRAQYFFMGGFMDEGNSTLYWMMTALRVGTVVLGSVSLALWTRAPVLAPEVGAPRITDTPLLSDRLGQGILFWIGGAMVAWPFVVDLFVDPNQLIGGMLVPTAASEGYNLAFAIQVASVTIGLLVLMRLVFRIRLLWILVLYPVCCGVLFIAYVIMGFLHFTF